MHISGGSPTILQSLLLWFLESPLPLRERRVDWNWYLSGSCLSEVDQTKHLGILISVSGSSLNHISRSVSLARSSFFALQSVGSRFGCLHPYTSLRLFNPLTTIDAYKRHTDLWWFMCVLRAN